MKDNPQPIKTIVAGSGPAVFGYCASVNDCAHFSYGYSFDIYWYLLYLLLFMVFLISVYSHGNYFSVYYGILFFFGVFDYFSML